MPHESTTWICIMREQFDAFCTKFDPNHVHSRENLTEFVPNLTDVYPFFWTVSERVISCQLLDIVTSSKSCVLNYTVKRVNVKSSKKMRANIRSCYIGLVKHTRKNQ